MNVQAYVDIPYWKLSSAKLSHFSDIWSAFCALLFLLEAKGELLGPLLKFEYSKVLSTLSHSHSPAESSPLVKKQSAR